MVYKNTLHMAQLFSTSDIEWDNYLYCQLDFTV